MNRENSIIPHNFDRALINPDTDLSNLSHLQKVVGLVYMYLKSDEERITENIANTDEKKLQGLSGIELLKFAVKQRDETDKDLPLKLTQKLMENGDPFGFGENLTRATLEMARDIYATVALLGAIEIGTYNPKWNPKSVEFLDSIIIRMYEEGMWSGASSIARNEFPSFMYYEQIFPPSVKRQMEVYRNEPAAKGGFII